MFLAIKEIKHEKMRYGLIILMIFLIAYLIFMLSSLAVGLASENTQALNSWQAKKVVLNKNANLSLSQSILTKKDLQGSKINRQEDLLGLAPIVAKHPGRPSISAQFIGVRRNHFLYRKQQVIKGHKAKNKQDIVADQDLQLKGYHLGDKLSLNGSAHQYRLVGFVQNAKINIAPIIYGSLKAWQKIKGTMPNVKASAVISRTSNYHFQHKNAKTYPVQQVINKLPGYTAQNRTFVLMISFLFVISLIVIAVFLYILTMQKMHNFAVMRAQGIPAKTLVVATVMQALLLVLAALLLALLCLALTIWLMPKSVPLSVTGPIILAGATGMLVMGLIGSLIPIPSILRIDPAQAIGA